MSMIFSIPKTAFLLGIGGLIPFAGLACLSGVDLSAHGLAPDALHAALTSYAALIASFIGGVRWGLAAVRRPGESRDFILSVLPSLIAWVALALPRPADLLMLMVLFTAMGIVDTVSQNDTLIPEWYRRLRMILTLGVVGSLTIAVVLSP